MRTVHVTVGFASLALSCSVIAHPNDPKANSIMPPYVGEGYRADEGGVAGITFPAVGITMTAWLPLGDFGPQMTAGNDCWGYVAPSGREYAIMGLSHGTGFVEITNPGNPVIVEVIAGPTSVWRDIKIYQTYAYAVTEDGDGIQVMDLGDIDNGNVTLINTELDGGTAATHNVALNEDSGYLYRCGGSGNGLRIYSLIADPTDPAFVVSWPDRYVHDAQIVTYTSGPYAGKEIAFCCAGLSGGSVQTGLTILDVTVKENIQELAHLEYPQNAYSHQGWLSPDRQYFYLADEGDEGTFGIPSTVHTIDVSVLDTPVWTDSFTNGVQAVTHNLYTVDDLIFAANYTSGLRVFDASDPLAPVEIGHFDTVPDDVGSGLWSNYPYFPSCTIIGSDREKGLFVWASDDLLCDELIVGDLDGDGTVGISDFLELLGAWGPCGAPCPPSCNADLDGDCNVGIADFLTLLANWS